MTEEFTAAERCRLKPRFTNLDRPCFALRNLPETVRGALFARYSRSAKPLRRLYLDEFNADLPPAASIEGANEAGGRAAALYDRVLGQYGDDSVAQLGSAHVACEGVSNVLTKVLERGRLMSYLEQSTRYVPYTERPGGRWKYVTPVEIDDLADRRHYRETLDNAFETYTGFMDVAEAYFRRAHPARPGDDPNAWKRHTLPHARHAARPAARGHAQQPRHPRLRPGLRGAAAAPRRAPAGRGPGDGHSDADRTAASHPRVRTARRARRPRRRLARLPPHQERRGGGRRVHAARRRPHAVRRRRQRRATDRLDRRRRDRRAGRRAPSAHRTLAERPAAHGGPDARRAARAADPPDRGRAQQPPAPPRPRVRARRLHLRGHGRLRRLPRPAAPPHADHRVAAADHAPRSLRAGRARHHPRPAVRLGPGDGRSRMAPQEPATALRERRRPVRRPDGLPHPLHHAHERARGDARHRAAHPAGRAPIVPPHLPADAPAHLGTGGHEAIAEAVRFANHDDAALGRIDAENRQERTATRTTQDQPA